jgi:hypothetical protein
MGCQHSKGRDLGHVDDSVHVMLSHDKKVAKQKGQPPPQGYVPRAEHPLLKPRAVVATEEGDGDGDAQNDTTKNETSEEETKPAEGSAEARHE